MNVFWATNNSRLFLPSQSTKEIKKQNDKNFPRLIKKRKETVISSIRFSYKDEGE